jgi:hypothetical protein
LFSERALLMRMVQGRQLLVMVLRRMRQRMESNEMMTLIVRVDVVAVAVLVIPLMMKDHRSPLLRTTVVVAAEVDAHR